MDESRPGRRIFATASLPMRPYDLDGPLQPEMSYAPLSHDSRSERGSYLMRMEPGAATIPHVQTCREEFLILEGEAIEDWNGPQAATGSSTKRARATIRVRSQAACCSVWTGIRPAKLIEQFNAYEVAPGLHINGKLTLGENIADLGGLATAPTR